MNPPDLRDRLTRDRLSEQNLESVDEAAAHVSQQTTQSRSASLLIVLMGVALSLPLVVVPALSRGSVSRVWWSLQEGGAGMWLLIAVGCGQLLVMAVVGARGAGASKRWLLLLSSLVLPVAGWALYHLNIGEAIAVVEDSSIEPLQKRRILAVASSEAGNLLSLTAFLAVPVFFVTAACATASAVAATPRLSFGRVTLAGAVIGCLGLIAAVAVAAQQPGEAWLWLQGMIAAIGGVALSLFAFAAIDGDEAPSPVATSNGVVGQLAFGASLGAAYFAARNEITSRHFDVIGGQSIEPMRQAEVMRAGVESLAGIGTIYGVLLACFGLLIVTLIGASKGRAVGVSTLCDGVAVSLGPLAVGALVLLSPERPWTFIEELTGRTEPHGFAFMPSTSTRLERYGGVALYIASDTLTVAGGEDLHSVPLRPIDDCPRRLEKPLSALFEDGFVRTALAIARDAGMPGIRCGVEAIASAGGGLFVRTGLAPGPKPPDAHFEPVRFDLVLEHPVDSAGLPAPLDTLAAYRGTAAVQIEPRPSRAGTSLHLTPEAWLLGSDAFTEPQRSERLTGSDEERFAQLEQRVASGTDLQVSADSDVRAEWIVRALLLSDSRRLALSPEAPPPSVPRPDDAQDVTSKRSPRDGTDIRAGAVTVDGGLPAEVVERIVRQSDHRFRLCYQQALVVMPTLQGYMKIRFVITSDGAVSAVSSGGSNLPHTAMTNCVLRAFYGISFPRPKSGSVAVTYPLHFAPFR